MTNPSSTVLIVGNFMSRYKGTRGVCEDLADRLMGRGWTTIDTSSRKNALAKLADMLWTTYRHKGRYDVAHVEVYSGRAFIWAEATCWLLRRLGKPYVLTLHGGNLPSFASRNPARMRRLLATAAYITTPSRYLYDTMQPYAENLRVLPNALDLSAYTFVQRTAATPKLVWLRAFAEVYNVTLAAEVVARLKDDYPTLQLYMIGPDKQDGSLEAFQARVEALDIGEHITIVGRVPKEAVPTWMNKGDVFLNTTNFDNTPVSVMEAMAAGLCVVSTDAGGLPYLLDDGEDALLVPVGDADAMAGAVRRILEDPALAETLSRKARARAERFDWASVLPQWEAILVDMLKENVS